MNNTEHPDIEPSSPLKNHTLNFRLPAFTDKDDISKTGLGFNDILLLFITYIASITVITISVLFFLVLLLTAINKELATNKDALINTVRLNGINIVNFLSYLTILILIYWIITKLKKLDFFKCLRLGFPEDKKWLMNSLIIGLILGIISVIINHYYPADIKVTGGGKGPAQYLLLFGALGNILIVIMTVIIAPVIEEILYRGFLFSALTKNLGIWLSGGIITLFYISQHFIATGRHLPAIFSITCLSLITLIIRVKSGSLIPPIIFHFFYNLVISIVLFFY